MNEREKRAWSSAEDINIDELLIMKMKLVRFLRNPSTHHQNQQIPINREYNQDNHNNHEMDIEDIDSGIKALENLKITMQRKKDYELEAKKCKSELERKQKELFETKSKLEAEEIKSNAANLKLRQMTQKYEKQCKIYGGLLTKCRNHIEAEKMKSNAANLKLRQMTEKYEKQCRIYGELLTKCNNHIEMTKETVNKLFSDYAEQQEKNKVETLKLKQYAAENKKLKEQNDTLLTEKKKLEGKLGKIKAFIDDPFAF